MWEIRASSWFYYKNFSRCTVTWTSYLWPVFRDFSLFCWRRLENSGFVNGEFGIKNRPVCQGLLIIEASRSHSDTPHLVGIHRTSYRPDAETSTAQHTALTRDNHALAWFEPKIPAREWPQTHVLYLAVTGMGTSRNSLDISLKRKSYQCYLHFSQFIFHNRLSLLQCMNVRVFTSLKNERTKSSNSTALHTVSVSGINVFGLLPWTELSCHISLSVYWNVHSRLNKGTESSSATVI